MPLAIRRWAAVATALLVTAILAPGSGRAQAPPQFLNKTSETLTFGGYVQTRWQYTTLDNAVPSNTFRIRRARLKLQAVVNPMVKPTLELDIVPGGVVLKDVFPVVPTPSVASHRSAGPGAHRQHRGHDHGQRL